MFIVDVCEVNLLESLIFDKAEWAQAKIVNLGFDRKAGLSQHIQC